MTQDIRPSRIAAGIGNADRKALSTYLALYEDSGLINLLTDSLSDQARKVRDWTRLEDEEPIKLPPAFSQRVEASAARIEATDAGDDELRLRLWIHLREALELNPRLTYSRRGLPYITADIAAAVAANFSPPDDDSRSFLSKVRDPEKWVDWFDQARRRLLGSQEVVAFSDVVRTTVLSLVSVQASDAGTLSTEHQRELIDAVKRYINECDQETAGQLLNSVGASELSDGAVVKILGTSGSFISLAVAVQLTGFSAYILAAQASAIIPFIGGQTAVSLLAVLANPIFTVSVVIGSLLWGGNAASRAVKRAVSLPVSTLLALQGLEQTRDGETIMLNAFADYGLSRTPLRSANGLESSVLVAYRRYAAKLDPAACKPPVAESSQSTKSLMEQSALGNRRKDAIHGALFPDQQDNLDAITLSALTIGDLVYHASQIRPEVMAALDFSHTADIATAFDVSGFVDKLLQQSAESLAGSTNRIQGYVAEQIVASRLVEQGHMVELPESASQPGFDLLVDGQPFQVKSSDSLAPLIDHFENAGYDYPVIVPAELANHVAGVGEDWAKDVYFIEGYDAETVTQITEDALEGGKELLDNDVPIFAVAITAARNLHSTLTGQLSTEEAAWQTVLQGSIRGGLAIVGGFAGKYGGLLIFGPAGAVIGNATVPLLLVAQSQSAAGQANRWLSQQLPGFKEWEADATEAAHRLLTRCRTALEAKMEIIEERRTAFSTGELARYVADRLNDEKSYLRERASEIRATLHHRDFIGAAAIRQSLDLAMRSTVHPFVLQAQLDRVKATITEEPSALPSLTSYIRRTWELRRNKRPSG